MAPEMYTCFFFSIDMNTFYYKRSSLVEWSIVEISIPDKNSFWSGAYLQICQGQYCKSLATGKII